MSAYLAQAKRILNEVELNESAIKDAKVLLDSMTKQAGLSNLVNDPKFQNVINLLTPFIVNWKINQVLRLLDEIGKENQKGLRVDPDTGIKRYI